MAKLFPKWLYSFVFPLALYESFSGGWFPFVFWSCRQSTCLRIKYGRGMHAWGGGYRWSAPGRRGLHLIRKNAYSLISSCNRNFWLPIMFQGQMRDCAFTPYGDLKGDFNKYPGKHLRVAVESLGTKEMRGMQPLGHHLSLHPNQEATVSFRTSLISFIFGFLFRRERRTSSHWALPWGRHCADCFILLLSFWIII